MAKCCSLTDGWSEGSNLKIAAADAAGQKVRSQVATPAETNDNLSAAAKILRLAVTMRGMVSVRAADIFTTAVEQLVWKAADEQLVCWCQLKAAAHIEAP